MEGKFNFIILRQSNSKIEEDFLTHVIGCNFNENEEVVETPIVDTTYVSIKENVRITCDAEGTKIYPFIGEYLTVWGAVCVTTIE